MFFFCSLSLSLSLSVSLLALALALAISLCPPLSLSPLLFSGVVIAEAIVKGSARYSYSDPLTQSGREVLFARSAVRGAVLMLAIFVVSQQYLSPPPSLGNVREPLLFVGGAPQLLLQAFLLMLWGSMGSPLFQWASQPHSAAHHDAALALSNLSPMMALLIEHCLTSSMKNGLQRGHVWMKLVIGDWQWCGSGQQSPSSREMATLQVGA